jgi:hypothetical protein
MLNILADNRRAIGLALLGMGWRQSFLRNSLGRSVGARALCEELMSDTTQVDRAGIILIGLVAVRT